MDDIAVTPEVTIPGRELAWTFTTSGGPGGQHANRSATRAVLRWDVAASTALEAATRARLLDRLASHVEGGVVEIAVDDTRSQWRNRRIARTRLAELVREALRPPPPPRRRSRPSAAARRRRMEWKRRRGRTKRLRKPPEPD